MADSLVLRKGAHWFVVDAAPGRNDRRAMVLSLIRHAEQRDFDIPLDQVEGLVRTLGWTLECRRGFLRAA